MYILMISQLQMVIFDWSLVWNLHVKVQSSKLSNFFSHWLFHGPDSGACNVGSAFTQENLNNSVKCCVDIDLSNINSAETRQARQAKYELKEVRTTFIKKLIFKRVTNNIHNYNNFYMYYCTHVNTVLTWMHYLHVWTWIPYGEIECSIFSHVSFRANLNALWRIWMPIMNFWLPYGDSEWLFFFFGCPMAILNAYFGLLAALWRFWMTSLNFWLPYSEIEWTIYTLACTKCEIGRENLY